VDNRTAWNQNEIRARLMVLAGDDPSRHHGRYELGPVLSKEQVRRFEQRYGVTLPESYRSFVTTVGDGGAGPYNGLWSLSRAYGPEDEAWWPGFLATPFPHTLAVGPDSLGDDYDQDELVTGSMILADVGCGASARLVVTGAARGQVWFDHLGIDSTLEPGPDFRDWYLGWLWPESLWSPRG